ncbi:gamma-glutamyl-gamma-aminobutyrate hydrolase family protein [Yoonia sp. 208BN28-4]|uniref:gamma-glutamyl-gamma-aminobutyrate hydrolase family protein n=1 Tax=Yoonia sp. 208BN28-4 TaxID=3126505 RepID=UPI0030ABB0CB
MTRPVVAITQRRDRTGPPYNETRDALDVRLADFVQAAGGWPVPVPSGLAPQDVAAWCAACNITAVVLSGGGDIGADAARDDMEAALVAHAAVQNLPLLGICRGMQMLAHIAGTACQMIDGHVATRHTLNGMGDRTVNSFHNLALMNAPDGYRILAKTPDGAIEAIRHNTRSWEGWMWHPERDDALHPDDIARLKDLIT